MGVCLCGMAPNLNANRIVATGTYIPCQIFLLKEIAILRKLFFLHDTKLLTTLSSLATFLHLSLSPPPKYNLFVYSM